MSTISTSFTAVGVSTGLLVVPNQTATYGISGTYAATLVFEKTTDGGQTWTQINEYSTPNATVSATVTEPGTYRWRCTSRTSGTAVATITGNAYQILFPAITNQAGEVVFEVTSDGISTKTVTQSAPASDLNGFTGASNTGLGTGAADSITTGTACTAVGVDALADMTDGVGHTAVGKGAAASLTGGQDTTAVGAGSLALTTTGTENTAVGFEAGKNITTGSDNIAIGMRGLYGGAVTGANNIGIGTASMANLTAGAGNVGVGYHALLNETDGANNVAVGHEAGTEVVSGTGNALVGYQAGKAQGDISNTAGFSLGNGQAVYFTVDEMGNLLNIAVRYAAGTMKAATIPLV